MRNKMFLWTALILRLVIASIFYHPDIKSQHFHASFLPTGVINIYEYLSLHKTSLPYSDTFNYPPLTYFFLGTWQQVITPLTGEGLHTWLWDWGEKAIYNPNLFAYLLLLKLPYLIADITILYICRHLLSSVASKTRFTYLWLLNPISLYIVYMIGQFDNIPTLLTVIALLAFIRSKYFLTGLLLGLGAAFKTYPLLLLPIFFLAKPNLKLGFSLGIGALFGWLGPNIWFLSSPAYHESVLQSSLASRLFALRLGGLPIFIPYFLAILLSVFKTKNFLVGIFITTLSLVLFTDFHAQWLMWSLPFACLLASQRPALLKYLAALYLLALVWIFFIPDQYVLIGLFSPLNPYLVTVPALSSFVSLGKLPTYLHYFLLILGTFTALKAFRYEKSS